MKKLSILFAVIVISLMFAMSVSALESEEKHWVASWGTAPLKVSLDGLNNIINQDCITARVVLVPTVGGEKFRIRLSNYYGEETLKIKSITVAKSVENSKIVTDTIKIVTFIDGSPDITIPKGMEIYSDAIRFPVEAGEPIAISILFENYSSMTTIGMSCASSFVTAGDATRVEDFDLLKTVIDDNEMLDNALKLLKEFDGLDLKYDYNYIKFIPSLVTVEVLADKSDYSIVVVGDETVANEFSSYLSQSICEQSGSDNIGVIDKSVIGNKLLMEGLGLGSNIFCDSASLRFQRDVLSQAGVKYVVIKIGANDIIHSVCEDLIERYPDINQPTAQEIIEGYRKIFKQCHDAGINIVVVSITQWKGTIRDYFNSGPKYVRTIEEFQHDWQIAKDVNNWLRTTVEHDGFVELTELSANPLDKEALRNEYTTNGIQPTVDCQKIWCDAFPKDLIGVKSIHKHIYNEYIYNDNATCVSNGTKTAKCSECIAIDTIEVKNTVLPHTFTTYISDGKATCTTDGLKIAKCDYCEATDSIPEKGGHSYSDKWTIDIEPTCTSEGLKSHHCVNCEEKTDITPIGKLAHTYNKTIIDPTCTDKGYNVYTCSCGDTYTETIEALGHSFDGSECINCDYDKADDCSCNCHKGGISGLIWKILNFFYKLFRMNEECVCGAEHW